MLVIVNVARRFLSPPGVTRAVKRWKMDSPKYISPGDSVYPEVWLHGCGHDTRRPQGAQEDHTGAVNGVLWPGSVRQSQTAAI